MEAKPGELETRLHTLENPVNSQAPIVGVDQGSLATVNSPLAEYYEQPGNRASWVTHYFLWTPPQ